MPDWVSFGPNRQPSSNLTCTPRQPSLHNEGPDVVRKSRLGCSSMSHSCGGTDQTVRLSWAISVASPLSWKGRSCAPSQSELAEDLSLPNYLGGHLKTGQWWTGQNRPTDGVRD